MTWEPIEEARAKQRKLATQNNHTADLKNFSGLDSGLSRDVIARRVGLGSGVTYEKGKAVVVRIDSELRTGDYHRYAEILRSQLNEQSIIAIDSPCAIATKDTENFPEPLERLQCHQLNRCHCNRSIK
jgi:hypothetical protein